MLRARPEIAGGDLLSQLNEAFRVNMGRGGDGTGAAEAQRGEDQIVFPVITSISPSAISAMVASAAAAVLDGDDARVACEPAQRGQLHGDAGALWNVVQDHRHG